MKTSRRIFIGALVATVLGIILNKFLFITDTLQRIKVRLWPSSDMPSDSERATAELPDEGTAISVETALNSRCTSDYDGHPKVFHWGMFDKEKKLDVAQVKMVSDAAVVPRFTPYLLKKNIDSNIIAVMSEKVSQSPDSKWLAIESGMLQQAICLACSALGIGMVFKAHGNAKSNQSENMLTDIRLKLDPMKPSYDGAYWTDSSPTGRKPWLNGNLSKPIRKSNQPLLGVMSDLNTSHDGNTAFDDRYLSQVLWAARGRTPHYYKSKPWGMTIPTNMGVQDNTEVVLITNPGVSRYINWQNDRPTHQVESQDVSPAALDIVNGVLKASNACILLKINHQKIVSFWEVGYQLLNAMLQSRALNLSYKAVLLSDEERQSFSAAGINDAVAAVLY